MNSSLRRRLLLTLLGVVSVAWLAAALASYYKNQYEIEALFDAELNEFARILNSISGHELVEERLSREQILPAHTYLQVSGEPYSLDYQKKLAFQVWVDHENLALRSQSAPTQALSRISNGLTDELIDGRIWRIAALHHDELPIQIYVGEPRDVRDELGRDITLHMLLPLLVALPVLAMTIWYGVGYALRPLHRLATEMSRRDPNHLAPLDDSKVPQEARPLTQSLNHLLKRVQHAFDYEHRFTADVAHELRTPLAGIKIQAQVAQRGTPAERQTALAQVVRGVDAADRIVHQLLTLARLDPESDLSQHTPQAIAPIAADVLTDLAPHALAKRIDIILTATHIAEVRGSRDALAILLSNLVDNAIQHTPARGSVEVRIEQSHGEVLLSVSDSGPGVPATEYQKILRRFYRRPGNGSSGSGLGLSIVQRIADLHRAQLRLGRADLGGLHVELRFPAADAGAPRNHG